MEPVQAPCAMHPLKYALALQDIEVRLARAAAPMTVLCWQVRLCKVLDGVHVSKAPLPIFEIGLGLTVPSNRVVMRLCEVGQGAAPDCAGKQSAFGRRSNMITMMQQNAVLILVIAIYRRVFWINLV